MNRILLIIKREFITRVKKKSFIIITILSPIAFALLLVSPTIINKLSRDEYRKIMVIDESNIFQEALVSTKYINFNFVTKKYFDYNTRYCNLDDAKKDLKNSDYFAILYIKSSAISTSKATNGEIALYSLEQPNLGLEMHITNCIEKKIEDIKLSIKSKEIGITQEDVENILKTTKTQVNLSIITIDGKGNEKEISSTISRIIASICGMMIYFFIFMYGSMVMRGVIEEKTSRIVEIIVSSVKPFQLMMGKIIGIALVGAAQFLLWIVLTFSFVSIANTILTLDIDTITNFKNIANSQTANININMSENQENFINITNSILNINFPLIIVMFVIYFVGGYILYASLFAAIGAVVDNETDSQQFTLPVSLPLIIGILMMFATTSNPSSDLTFWGSIIPFTSPIIMLARIPMGVHWSDLIISILVLYITAIFCIWLAGKVYRTGILLYGKKNTWKDIFKWIKLYK